ncbi:glycosyltransferase, partial [Moorena sp. SIO4G3]
MIDFTVAICTYNGETRLPQVLKRLLYQIKTDHFAWEILIIDNNSTDNTSKIVEEYQSHPGAYPIRYYFEPKQGIAFARRRAIQESKGEYVGFLDDDNLPTSDWVS